ncbi:MAG TPA: dTDP-4-dehydrorhamnose 3,5-epimerase [Caulobacteraceae bacterium]|jgi:dTDP-4-dehydrorhamnose 3,5-epimerase|nr:dTDP-4-dehydrorhamnose 3,5-epimerase [Caulobacteraceae bacterium]
MNFLPTPIAGAHIIEPRVFGDARGWFMETWRADAFAAAGIGPTFVQDNHSRSVRGVLRGLHYQSPNPQGKLIRVAAGAVFDVIVDLRAASPSFRQWFGLELSADNHRLLWAPPGVAHGFLTLSESCDFLYRCTAYHDPASERSVRWDDPDLAIAWPLGAGAAPTVSAKDAAAPPLAQAVIYP